MRKIIAFVVLAFLLSSELSAQDKALINKTPVQVPDTILQKLAKRHNNAMEVRQKTDAFQISYWSDGFRINGYLVVPKKPGKYPCVIYNRGGNREFGKLDAYDYGYYMAEIASWGYTVIASQYRGNGGSEGREEFGGKDVDDVLNLFGVLSDIKEADTSRVGMYGVSRGGMMTYISLKKTSRLKAAVVVSGVTDLIKMMDTRPEMDTFVYAELIPSYASEKIQQLKNRSAVYFADSISRTTPLLILQGTADWRVPADQVLDLVQKLYASKVPLRFSLFEGGTHGINEFETEVSHETKLFLDSYLRDLSPLPTLSPHGH